MSAGVGRRNRVGDWEKRGVGMEEEGEENVRKRKGAAGVGGRERHVWQAGC